MTAVLDLLWFPLPTGVPASLAFTYNCLRFSSPSPRGALLLPDSSDSDGNRRLVQMNSVPFYTFQMRVSSLRQTLFLSCAPLYLHPLEQRPTCNRDSGNIYRLRDWLSIKQIQKRKEQKQSCMQIKKQVYRSLPRKEAATSVTYVCLI